MVGYASPEKDSCKNRETGECLGIVITTKVMSLHSTAWNITLRLLELFHYRLYPKNNIKKISSVDYI